MNENDKQAEPVAYMQVYRCKIKSKARIDREIPREKQGWWADVAAGGLIRLRQATQSDIDRCALNDAHSKNPNDYMCETFKKGALVSKIALEYMNLEEDVFVRVYTHPAQPVQPAVAVNEQMLEALRLIRGKHGCGALTLPQADLERVDAAIAAAEAEKAKGGV